MGPRRLGAMVVALLSAACVHQRAGLGLPSPRSVLSSDSASLAFAGSNGVPSAGQAFLIALGIGLVVLVVVLLGGKGNGP